MQIDLPITLETSLYLFTVSNSFELLTKYMYYNYIIMIRSKHFSPIQPGVQPLSELVPLGHLDPEPKI